MWRASAGVLEQPGVDLRSVDHVHTAECVEGGVNFQGALVVRSVTAVAWVVESARPSRDQKPCA